MLWPRFRSRLRHIAVMGAGLASNTRVVFFGNTPDESQLGLIVAMLHCY